MDKKEIEKLRTKLRNQKYNLEKKRIGLIYMGAESAKQEIALIEKELKSVQSRLDELSMSRSSLY